MGESWTDTGLGVRVATASGFKLRTWRAGVGYWGYSIGDGGTLEATGRMFGGDGAAPPDALLATLQLLALACRAAIDAHSRAIAAQAGAFKLAAAAEPAPTT